MIISINWLKKYTSINHTIEELATLIGARLVEIEGLEVLGKKYEDVIVAKVMECSDVPDSDHLHVTKIDDGGIVSGVERDENGYVQVVCGAPNVRQGILVAWLPPGSTVPETADDKEPFVLGVRPLRGYASNGMLASAKELALYDEHEGILEIDKTVEPGSRFSDTYELNDTLLDIENKSLTHRPDTFGVVGFAREVAGIQGEAFTTPSFLQDLTPSFDNDGTVEAPRVMIDEPELSERYQAIVLAGSKTGAQAPVDIQTFLSRSGSRPISAIVDATNYLMLATGQPLHAFDYDKLVKVGGSADIHVRRGREDEQLKLLDGRTITLSPEDIVIAAGETAVALAGAMGGADTEIDESTKNIIIESATFNLYNLRATQMRHGIFSEAITRFTKGQPAPLTAPVLAEAVRLIGEWTGAHAVSNVAEAYPSPSPSQSITVSRGAINAVLGTSLTLDTMVKTLTDVEFAVETNEDELIVTPPYWRRDVHIQEDVIEEIGRLNGFDSIALSLPNRTFAAVEPSGFDRFRSSLRELLSRAGANEVLTYAFVHGDLMKKVGQNPDDAYRIVNSISPDLQFYRQSIVPSLLSQVYANVRAGYDSFALYELNKFHTKKAGLTEEAVPKELDSLGFVVTDVKGDEGAYYTAKHYLDYLLDKLHIDVTYEVLEADSDYPVTQPFEPKRSARLFDRITKERIGVVGELRRSVTKSLKLPQSTAAFEVSPRALYKLQNQDSFYQPSSKFPTVERDVCFQVEEPVNYQDLYDVVTSVLDEQKVISKVDPFDIYRPESTDDGILKKNITLRLRLTSFDKTLTGDEIASIVTSIGQAANDRLRAVII